MTVLFFCTEGHSLALGIRVTRSQKKFLNESIFSSAMTKVHFAPNGTFKRKVDATLKILPRKTQIFFSFNKSMLKIIDGALVLFSDAKKRILLFFVSPHQDYDKQRVSSLETQHLNFLTSDEKLFSMIAVSSLIAQFIFLIQTLLITLRLNCN